MAEQKPYTLYYNPGTASMVVHWLLLELDVAFKTVLVDFQSNAQRDAEYLRLNPQGRVPTLVIDDEPYAESAALLMLLAERHPSACLAPAVGAPDRARWLVGMVFLANTVLPAMRDNFYAGKDGDPSGAEAVVELARRRIEDAMDVLDRQLDGGRRFLVGDSLTTVDLLAVMLMRWARAMPKPATEWPNLRSYIGRMTRMPSWIELNRREGLTGWPPVLE